MDQGFAWRPGSVSFRTLIDGGACMTTLETKSELTLRSETLRAIQVPFTVPRKSLFRRVGRIEVGSIFDTKQLEIAAGDYCLVFETGLTGEDQMWCGFSLMPQVAAAAAILRNDGLLSPPDSLLMEAEPA